jgi:hypothetical protein
VKRVDRLETVFMDEIPETLEDGFLYVSQQCRVALHNCACGCGEEVSTPLVPTEYDLTVNEEGASIWPSVGNHDFACMSHYVIDCGEIVWAGKMSRTAIEAGRRRDRRLKRPPTPAATPTFQRWFFGRGMLARIRAACRKILGR